MGLIAKVAKHLFTESDNETYDTTRTIYVLSWLVAIGGVIYNVGWLAEPFDVQAFGTGMGLLTAAFGLSKLGEGKGGTNV